MTVDKSDVPYPHIMRGDLHTLKRICEYASKVMLLGIVAISATAVIASVVGIGSLGNQGMESIAKDVFGLSRPDSLGPACLFLQRIYIMVLGAFTVFVAYRLMVSARTEPSPFTKANTDLFVKTSYIYLISAAVLGILTQLAGNSLLEVLFVLFGCILVGVLLYCLALVIRYGSVLQEESDTTL